MGDRQSSDFAGLLSEQAERALTVSLVLDRDVDKHSTTSRPRYAATTLLYSHTMYLLMITRFLGLHSCLRAVCSSLLLVWGCLHHPLHPRMFWAPYIAKYTVSESLMNIRRYAYYCTCRSLAQLVCQLQLQHPKPRPRPCLHAVNPSPSAALISTKWYCLGW